MVADNQGRIIARAAALKEDLLLADLALPAVKKFSPGTGGVIKPVALANRPPLKHEPREELSSLAEVYQALSLIHI